MTMAILVMTYKSSFKTRCSHGSMVPGLFHPLATFEKRKIKHAKGKHGHSNHSITHPSKPVLLIINSK